MDDREKLRDGIVDQFSLDETGRFYRGVRTFPNGVEEMGKFLVKDGSLFFGSRINSTGEIECVTPKSLVNSREAIVDFDGELLVFEDGSLVNRSIGAILMESGKRSTIKSVLNHPGFIPYRRQFIEDVFSPQHGVIFQFSNAAAFEVVEGALTLGISFNPLQGGDLFIHAAMQENGDLLHLLLKGFPEIFPYEEVIATTLNNGLNPKHLPPLEKAIDPYHKVWMEIATKKISLEEFLTFAKGLDQEKRKTLFHAAWNYNNPLIYEPSRAIIESDQYSLNFLWIHPKKIPPDQKYVLEEALLFQVYEWALKNPSTPIYIWIDGEMTDSVVIKRSQQALRLDSIYFRDLREIEIVRMNRAVFDVTLPLYFRIDLLKAIIADYLLRQKESQFFVYADFDIVPLSTKELFDQRTIDFLHDFGFVLARQSVDPGFENSFQILSKAHESFLDSHKKIIIDLNIEMALSNRTKVEEQQVYWSYSAMMIHFLTLDGRYGPVDMGGRTSFRFDHFGLYGCRVLPFPKAHLRLKDIIPTKAVSAPPSKFSFLQTVCSSDTST